MAELRNSGIAPLGEIAWGTHVCHFYETASDLIETVVPYFAAGLAGGERCIWLVSHPVTMSSGEEALRNAIPDYEQHVARGALQIADAPQWYRDAGVLEPSRMIASWIERVDVALRDGFTGLRINGCDGWVDASERPAFHIYENALEASMSDKKIIGLCSYPLDSIDGADMLEVARSHQFVLTRRSGAWDLLERAAQLHTRHRQQSAIAMLGQSAIRARDLDALMREAASLAAETLGTGRSIVWQLRPEENDFVMRAQAGWDILAPGATIPVTEGSASEYVIGQDTPVMIDAGSPFKRSWLLREYNVATMISSVVRARERAWGMLSVHSLTSRSFTDDDVEFLQSMANVLSLAIERHEHQERERVQREVLQAIFDHSPVMMVFLDESDRIVYPNPALVQTLGWSQSDADRIDILAALYPDPERRERVRAFMRERSGRWEDFQMVTRSGRIVEATWAFFQLSSGSSIAFGLDITERKRAEEAQAKALAKLRAIESITDDALGRMTSDDMLNELVEQLREALAVDRAFVGFIDDNIESIAIRAAVPHDLRGVVIPILPAVRGILRQSQSFILNELPPPEADVWREYSAKGLPPPRALIGAPLIVQGKLIGGVAVSSLTPRTFTEDELDLLRMVAERAAPAIERSRLLETIRASRERLESLSHRLLSVQEEERRRVAVELHDELGQVHTAIKIKLGSMQRRSRSDGVRAELAEAMDIVDRAVGTVRDLALDLRPAMLDDLGLAAALRWYADRFAQQTGIAIHLTLPQLPPIDAGVATAFFRVVQEALTNVARHASARNVWIELHVGDFVELLVRDDGIGFDVDAAHARAIGGASLGILGMEERVSLVGGKFEITSNAGAGTKICARVPVRRNE